MSIIQFDSLAWPAEVQFIYISTLILFDRLLTGPIDNAVDILAVVRIFQPHAAISIKHSYRGSLFGKRLPEN